MEGFTIGKLADAAGVNVETVRYYERRGLLRQPPRTAGGYRRYSDADLWRLSFIARGKALGFTLAEIAELLGPACGCAADGEDRARDEILEAARRKIAVVEERQRELADMRSRLEQLADVCATGDGADCVALVITR